MYKFDYHTVVNEAKIIWDFFPNKVNEVKAKSLSPQNTFAPLGYVGDPADFKKGNSKETLQEIGDEVAKIIVDFFKNKHQKP